jgi:hypothetical protein
VLFDRIYRENGITHRLTAPASPTTTGERFHGSLRRELLNHILIFDDLPAAQAAIDAWVADYNRNRPHQTLDMDCPAGRFCPNPHAQQLPLHLPTGLAEDRSPAKPAPPTPATLGGPVTFTRVVPPQGNMRIKGKQCNLGRAYADVTITIWATVNLIQIRAGGKTIRSVPSHLGRQALQTLAEELGRTNPTNTDSDRSSKEVSQQQTRHQVNQLSRQIGKAPTRT